MEKYTTGTGQKLTVHDKEKCRGDYCVIHNPVLDWPTHWRDDAGFMEYMCPHGVGYPAPESHLQQQRAFGNCGHPECLKQYIDAQRKVNNEQKRKK